MMKLMHYLRRASSMPPQQLIRHVGEVLIHRLDAAHQQHTDRHTATYALARDVPDGPLHQYFPKISLDRLRSRQTLIEQLALRAIAHRFSLLGSGLVEVRHEGGSDQDGLDRALLVDRLNPANRDEAHRLWQLVDEEYTPIDWQLDFKSGFRWSEASWFKQISYGTRSGVDVKVPWELARMQHLPQLAWAFALAKSNAVSGPDAQRYSQEFRNQVLDFVASNPPRFGVNWHCTMEVGIRVADWLVAYDLFRAYGAQFDDEFEAAFRRTVYEHGRHIAHNLEWNRELRNNHYLANIVGLLFVAAWLPHSPEIDGWLRFVVPELIHEVSLQFLSDGSNFEASTCYHRLSAEMVAYATAVVIALPPEKYGAVQDETIPVPRLHPAPQIPGIAELLDPSNCSDDSLLPRWYFERLAGMAEFTMGISRPDGRVPQIGDNDSGRFLKLWPMFCDVTKTNNELNEDYLDHRHLTAALNGILQREALVAFSGTDQIETELIGGCITGDADSGTDESEQLGRKFGSSRKNSDCSTELFSASEFGIFVLRDGPAYLALRCGPVGQQGHGGHAHNDQLSFELCFDGSPIFVDPGTYVYTPSREERNRFRSTAMHNTLTIPGEEQNRLLRTSNGLFQLADRACARVISCSNHEIVAEQSGFSHIHRRTILVNGRRIVGTDECRREGEKQIFFHLSPDVQAIINEENACVELSTADLFLRLTADNGTWSIDESWYSPGYGERVPTSICCLSIQEPVVQWSIERVSASG